MSEVVFSDDVAIVFMVTKIVGILGITSIWIRIFISTASQFTLFCTSESYSFLVVIRLNSTPVGRSSDKMMAPS